jgi:alkylation response protein AidB-like acyl-CoA dehydrogenase
VNFRPTLDFLLYDWLQAQGLNQRERFADHSRETFDAVLDTCERIAREKYAPFNRTVDTQEPQFDGEKVILPQCTHDANRAYAESGMLSAAQDYDEGGMQLPYTIEAAANGFFWPGVGQHRLQPADQGQCQPAAGAWHRHTKGRVRAQ